VLLKIKQFADLRNQLDELEELSDESLNISPNPVENIHNPSNHFQIVFVVCSNLIVPTQNKQVDSAHH
jgi:hypothetical protein